MSSSRPDGSTAPTTAGLANAKHLLYMFELIWFEGPMFWRLHSFIKFFHVRIVGPANDEENANFHILSALVLKARKGSCETVIYSCCDVCPCCPHHW